VTTTTMTAGYELVFRRFLPMTRSADPAVAFKGGLNAWLTVIMVLCVAVILGGTAWRWIGVRRGTARPVPAYATDPIDPRRPPDRCC
jgi:hypothetical protein